MLVLRRLVVMFRPWLSSCLQAINGNIVVSAFFQASSLPGVTKEVRLLVSMAAGRPLTLLLTTTAQHGVLECSDKNRARSKPAFVPSGTGKFRVATLF